MIIKAKAPFRLGLAGGGTDVEPYTSLYGGEVINTTIGLYARVALETTDDDEVVLAINGFPELVFPMSLPPDLCHDIRDLFTVTYTRFLDLFGQPSRGLIVNIHTDVPAGSGLGTSSTIMVAVTGALLTLYGRQWTGEEIAAFAVDTERRVLGWAGGKQDQYAAVMGGFNHMVFRQDGNAEVTTIPIDPHFISLLEQSMLLYHTRQHRHSSLIIQDQQRRVMQQDAGAIQATHQVKAVVPFMREALIRGDLAQIGSLLHLGFVHKKALASDITNPSMDNLILNAMQAGALGAKISGAGGGGFITILCTPALRMAVQDALSTFDGQFYGVHFTPEGLTTRKY